MVTSFHGINYYNMQHVNPWALTDHSMHLHCKGGLLATVSMLALIIGDLLATMHAARPQVGH